MADIINEKREKFVDKVARLRKKKLYTKDEVKGIIERWTKQEVGIRRLNCDYNTYKQAINEEIKANKELTIRFEKAKLPLADSKTRMMFKGRALELYRRLCSRYPRVVTYWLEFAKYQEKIGLQSAAIKTYSDCIKFHSRSIEVWNALVDNLVNNNSDIKTGREMLQLCIKINNKSQDAWLCYFRFEVSYINNLLSRVDITLPDNEQIKLTTLQLWKIPSIVYQSAISEINDLQFKAKFLKFLTDENAVDLKNKVVQDIFDSASVTDGLDCIATTIATYNKPSALAFINEERFITTTTEDFRQKLIDKINGKVIKIDPIKEICDKINEIKDIDKKIEVMKTEMLNINRTHLISLKKFCLKQIWDIKKQISLPFIQWLLLTVCDDVLFCSISKWFMSHGESNLAAKCYEQAVETNDIAKKSVLLWVDYLLYCRSTNDWKLANKVQMKMKQFHNDPTRVEVEFEKKINGN
ncbi:U3 small nucleolar RNA-associated protein 6 N-terminal domain-containing protein [Entamoeba marina]